MGHWVYVMDVENRIQMNKRWIVSIRKILLTIHLSFLALLPFPTMADSAEAGPSYLVVITYSDQNDLQRLATLNLYLLDVQHNALAVIVTDNELVEAWS